MAATASQDATLTQSRGIVLRRETLFVASAVLMTLTLYLVFMWVPTERVLRESQRIYYFHVPLAWLGMLSIILVAAFSITYLKTRNDKWDNLSYAAAELGLVFLSLLLITGVIWNKADWWGVWWTWEAKLTTTLILWFIYVAYLMLRSFGPPGSQGARYGAVVALIGAIDTPIIYLAANWWEGNHPTVNVGPLSTEDSSVDPSMRMVLLLSVVAFTVLYAYLLREGYLLKRTESALDALSRFVP